MRRSWRKCTYRTPFPCPSFGTQPPASLRWLFSDGRQHTCTAMGLWLAWSHLVWSLRCQVAPEDSTDTADPHVLHTFWVLPAAASVIHVELRRQEWVVPGLHTFAPSLVLTPEQRRRRSLYFQPPPTESTANSRVECTAVVSSAEVQTWITRELQAITLEEDVKLLCQVVLGCLAAVAQSLHNSGRRYCALAFCISVSHCLCQICCNSIGADKEGTRGKHSQHIQVITRMLQDSFSLQAGLQRSDRQPKAGMSFSCCRFQRTFGHRLSSVLDCHCLYTTPAESGLKSMPTSPHRANRLRPLCMRA